MRSWPALVGLSVLVVAVIAGLALFQPWRLWTHSYVDEALPGDFPATAAAAAARDRRAADVRSSSSRAISSRGLAPARPLVLHSGRFVSGEHRTSGRAVLLRLAGGTLVVRLEDLDTSDGPDLHVVLAETRSGSSSIGDYLRLGRLKATSGNQNYAVPAGTDPDRFLSVAVWCRRFDAVFGSAPLLPG